MIQSILIPKIVYEALKNDVKLNEYINQRIFPMIAEFGTQFPYVAYSRTYITPTYTKDFYTEDTVGIEIIIASDDYLESLAIANQVRSIFECKTLKTSELTITQITLSSVTEAYDDQANAFVQRIAFDFKVN